METLIASLEVSIVIPCLNEAETITDCVKEAREALQEAEIFGEIIVADNGSTDGSQALAELAGASVVNVREKGYGSALLGGIAQAQGTYILMGDADGSYNFRELGRFMGHLRSGDDLVMGCRMPKGGGQIKPGAMPWLHRRLGNPVLTGIGKLFFKTPIDDFHCGLRAFRADTIRALNLRTTGMEFASEMVVKATLANCKVSQIPVTLSPDKRSRKPHLRSWRDGWRHLRFLLLYSPRWLFLYPGIFLFLVGLLGFTALLPGPLKLGTVTFDTNTLLLSSLAIIVGFQVINLYIFAKAYAASVGLLPPDPKIKKLLDGKPAEWGILIGMLFILGGIGLIVYALLTWQSTGFGQLSYPDSLRIIIPGVTAIGVGVQFSFGGFILAVLGIKFK
jgi:glycosyltransferase involved in cell wall biosynthesis